MFFSLNKEATEVAGAKLRTLRLGSIQPLTQSTPLDNELAQTAVEEYLKYLIDHSQLAQTVDCISNGLHAYEVMTNNGEEAQRFAVNINYLIQLLIAANANPEIDAIEPMVRKLFDVEDKHHERLIRALCVLLCAKKVSLKELADATE